MFGICKGHFNTFCYATYKVSHYILGYLSSRKYSGFFFFETDIAVLYTCVIRYTLKFPPGKIFFSLVPQQVKNY